MQACAEHACSQAGTRLHAACPLTRLPTRSHTRAAASALAQARVPRPLAGSFAGRDACAHAWQARSRVRLRPLTRRPPRTRSCARERLRHARRCACTRVCSHARLQVGGLCMLAHGHTHTPPHMLACSHMPSHVGTHTWPCMQALTHTLTRGHTHTCPRTLAHALAHGHSHTCLCTGAHSHAHMLAHNFTCRHTHVPLHAGTCPYTWALACTLTRRHSHTPSPVGLLTCALPC